MNMSLTRWAWEFCLMGLCLAAGCRSQPAAQATFAQKVADTHGWREWREQSALAGDVHVEFSDKRTLDAQFTYDIATHRVRMQLADNTILVFDGKEAWVSPPTATMSSANQLLRAWPFFFTAPLRLGEAGATVDEPQERELAGQRYSTATLSFPGQADAVGEWFILYADPASWRVQAMAFPSLYNQPIGDSGDSAVAITYYNFKTIDGVLFATEWRFWRWNREVGIHGMPVAEGRIYNLEFVQPKKNAFVPPPGARPALSGQ